MSSSLTRLQGVTYVSRVLLNVLVLEDRVSLLTCDSPLKNLSHSTLNVSCSNGNITDRTCKSSCIDSVLLELSQVRCVVAIELVCILEVLLRHVNISVSENLVLNLVPSDVLSKCRFVVVAVQIELSVNSERNSDLCRFSLNLILYDLYLQIAYSNDVVVNSIIEDNTYQRLTTDSRTLLGSAIRKLLTVVVNYLRTQSVAVSCDSSVSTLRSLVVALMITYKLECILEAVLLNFLFSSILSLYDSALVSSIIPPVCANILTEVDTLIVVVLNSSDRSLVLYSTIVALNSLSSTIPQL